MAKLMSLFKMDKDTQMCSLTVLQVNYFDKIWNFWIMMQPVRYMFRSISLARKSSVR